MGGCCVRKFLRLRRTHPYDEIDIIVEPIIFNQTPPPITFSQLFTCETDTCRQDFPNTFGGTAQATVTLIAPEGSELWMLVLTALGVLGAVFVKKQIGWRFIETFLLHVIVAKAQT
jgi:hypothetical protein